MKSEFDIFRLEIRFFKNRIIGNKSNARSCFIGFADDGKQSVNQFRGRFSAFIGILVDISVTFYLHLHILGKCVYNGRTDTVKTTGILIDIVVEFTSRMKSRKHDTLRADAFFMHIHGNSASVIGNGCRAVLIQYNGNLTAESRHMLVNGVIHNLIN